MSPAAGVLNYGQGLFEGMKAYRTVANRVVLFRPDQVSWWMPMGHALAIRLSKLPRTDTGVSPAERRTQCRGCSAHEHAPSACR